MSNISISIIIPMYNVEEYIEECILSVMDQIEDEDEIIIIDDGSTDNSFIICRKLIENKSNICLLQQHNKGLGATRNHGLNIAKGEYVLFVDSDDMLKENTIQELKIKLTNEQLDMLLFDADILMEYDSKPKKNSYDKHNVAGDKVVTGEEMFAILYPKYYSPSACLLISKREFLKNNKIQFPEGILHEDEVFTFQTLMMASSVACVPQKYYLRRYRENSIMTSGWSYRRWSGLVEGTILILNYLENESERIWRQMGIADIIAAFLYSKLNSILGKESEEFLVRSKWTDEEIIDRFLAVWNTYYRNVHDSFVKWKGSFYLVRRIITKNMTIRESMRVLFNDYERIEDRYNDYIAEKVNQIPFKQKGIRIGIYGMGKHSMEMLAQYRKLYGEIECECLFIDTYIEEKNTSYLDCPVLNINEVKGRVDVIVISSFIFQDDMNKKIDEILGNNFPRINLYNEDSVISYF